MIIGITQLTYMRRYISILFLFLLSATSLQAQIVKSGSKDKIGQNVKQGFTDVMNTIRQDTHPTGEHEMWDGYIGPRVGVGVASLPGGGGRPVVEYKGGAFVEVFVAKNLGISFEIDYEHRGGSSLEYSTLQNTYDENGNVTGNFVNSGKYDYNLNYLNTSYLAHWYPWSYRPLSLYAGLQLSYLAYAKAHMQGGTSTSIRSQLHKGEVDVPIGISYEWKQWEFDLRYFISPRKLASSRRAKTILGNARNMALSFSVAYRIKVF